MSIGLNIVRLDSADSTNNFAATMAKERLIGHGTVILAEEQTKGRGQRGNQWHARRGENLTFSVFLKPSALSIARHFQLTAWASVSIVEVLAEFDIISEIKWPNDVFVNEQKIAGILIENSIDQLLINEVIAGIGLNVNQLEFNGLNAVSMSSLLGRKLDREKVLDSLLKALNENWEKLSSKEANAHLMEAYFSHLFGKDQPRVFLIEGKLTEGIIRTVDENGFLCLEVENKRLFFDLKQVQFIFRNVS